MTIQQALRSHAGDVYDDGLRDHLLAAAALIDELEAKPDLPDGSDIEHTVYTLKVRIARRQAIEMVFVDKAAHAEALQFVLAPQDRNLPRIELEESDETPAIKTGAEAIQYMKDARDRVELQIAHLLYRDVTL